MYQLQTTLKDDHQLCVAINFATSCRGLFEDCCGLLKSIKM